MKMKQWLLPMLFTLGGGVTGFAYYLTLGCEGGRCGSVGTAMGMIILAATIGYLVSGLLGKAGGCKCNM